MSSEPFVTFADLQAIIAGLPSRAWLERTARDPKSGLRAYRPFARKPVLWRLSEVRAWIEGKAVTA